MKRQSTNGFNKEKLVFIGTSLLLAFSVYHMLTSAPVPLKTSEAVSPLPPPGPLERDKADTRAPSVLYYLVNGSESGMRDVLTNALVDRGRKNPFEPLDNWVPATGPAVASVKNPKTGPEAAPAPPPPPEPPQAEPKKKEEPRFDGKDQVALVDFSGVMTMNGMSYGLLKSKDDKTIQVKVGDYMEDYKYTVTKIEKQAIWVTDDENHTFVARDLTFDDTNKADAAEAEAPKKAKPGGAQKKQGLTAPTAPAAPKQQPQAPKNTGGNGGPQWQPGQLGTMPGMGNGGGFGGGNNGGGAQRKRGGRAGGG